MKIRGCLAVELKSPKLTEFPFHGSIIERGSLSCSPLGECIFPRDSVPLPHVVSPATFEQVMRAGFPLQGKGRRTILRDQALLRMLFETGITVSEVSTLLMADLDQQTGVLRVRSRGGKERQMPLGSICMSHLRSYLKYIDMTTKRGLTSSWWRSTVWCQGGAAADQEWCDDGICAAPQTSRDR